MRDSIRGCTQNKEDENSEQTRIRCHEEVISDFHQQFRSYGGLEAKPEKFVEAVVRKFFF